ncbi:MAG: sigma-70 family RNA polymerase sigma factor [Candidatus Pacebacteria bacterium]|nr:sigma-70 family RNA polymerase sigma factor [Candidatus Paceibacterota bacterium]
MLDGEEKIVRLAVEGDSSAFGLLYDHYNAMIYRFVIIKVGSREEAEDITHQVFLSAWQKVKTYKQRGYPFSSWLYQIARNQVIDHYRAKRGDISLEKADPESFAVSVDHNADITKKMQLETVRVAVAKLKPDYQDVIILRFVEDMSLRETGAALKKSEGAVKLLQHRAISELKEMLSDESSITFQSLSTFSDESF